jgi:hypothetical protein
MQKKEGPQQRVLEGHFLKLTPIYTSIEESRCMKMTARLLNKRRLDTPIRLM